MTITVEKIKRAYPFPQRIPDDVIQKQGGPPLKASDNYYCVGGALIAEGCNHGNKKLCELAAVYGGFPGETAIATALRELNPVFNEPYLAEQAFHFANRITNYNDTWQFNAAWRTLQEALTFTAEDYERDTEFVPPNPEAR